MEDSASAVLIGACAAVSVISFAAAYVAELVIPVQTKSEPAAPAAPAAPKKKTLEERVEFIEKKEGIPPPSAPPSDPPVLPQPPSAPPPVLPQRPSAPAPPAPPVQTQLTVG